MSAPVGKDAREDRRHTLRRVLLVAAILLVALNLRPALAGVGPLIAAIRADTGLSYAALGLLTTLPLIAFGVVSTFTPFVTARLGIGGALLLALALLSVGAAVRAVPSVTLLYGGTALFGIGIALGNVLMPTLVKREFPHRSGPLTSLYSSAMGLGATVAAGAAVPLATRLGWRAALGLWAIPAALALIAWLPQRSHLAHIATRPAGATLRALGRSRLAWQVSAFMGLQSLTFYVILAWLPDLLQARGLDAATAGWLLALSQATGIAGTALFPLWAGRVDDQRPMVWLLGALEAVALTGLIVAGTELWLGVWAGLLGFVLGGTFGLALVMLVVRAPDTASATGLSGMAQSIGYLIAAIGPVLFGLLFELTGRWLVPLLSLGVALVGKVAAGLPAAAPGDVGRA